MLSPVQNDHFVPALNDLTQPPEPQPDQSPGLDATLGAAFRQENTIGSMLSNQMMGVESTPDPTFDFTQGVVGTKYEPYIDKFAKLAFNKDQQSALMRQIDREEEDRNTLQASGWTGTLAELGAGLFDPVNLVPFGGEAYRGVRTAETAGRFAKSFATVGALAAGTSELGLQASQQLRTGTESAFAIGGGAILGGILGAGLGAALGRDPLVSMAKAIEKDINLRAPDPLPANEDAVMATMASAGAAASPKATLEGLTVAGRAAKGVADSTAPLNPLLRVLSSPSVAARDVGTQLMENPIYLKKNFEGEASAPAVETLMKEYTQGRLSVATSGMQDIYRDYRKSGGALKYDAFRDEVGRAMRRSDQSADPHIQKSAELWRAQVFDPLKERAIEAGLLPKDVSVETAASYFSRVYNKAKIEANEGAFKSIVSRWLDGELQKVEAATAKAEAAGKKAENAVPAFTSEADRQDYVKGIASEIFNTITGRNADGDIPRDIVPDKRGPLKERTFNIPDHMIEDFLESDVEAVGHRYTRTMAADVELKTKFGSPKMDEQLKAVRDDYQKLRDQVGADKTMDTKGKERQLQRIKSAEDSDIRDLKAVRDMLRGSYKVGENNTNFARAAAVFNTLNYLRAMGGVVLSSATDVARHIMVHGMTNVMHDGIVPLMRNLKAVKMSVAEAKQAGAIAERILNTRMATWAEITDPYGHRSPFERFLENTARGFSKLNGMGYWNDFQKSFASVLTQARVLRGSVDFANAKPREKAYLAFLGIDEDMAARIAKEFDAHGETIDGVRVANTDEWTDDLARRTYRAAINKDVDSNIVTKGVGDTPLFSHTPVGRAVLQFKSFALASHQRAFIRGMQESPAGVVSGTLTATAIGMLIYYLKAVESNRVDKLSDNPGHWIAEGLDRSGMFAVAFEANNTVEKALGIGAYGALESLFPSANQGGKASRYMTRSTAAALTGPTGDFIDTLVKITQAATNGQIKESDVNAMRRLAPFATLPGIRSIVEYLALPAAKRELVTQ